MSSLHAPHRPRDAEAERLARLGWDQVYDRRMSPLANMAAAISVVSVLTGCTGMYGFGLTAGGPAALIWGWTGVSVAVLLIGLSLAEITSAYPTAGAMYAMAEHLGGARSAWYTGWLNMVGLWGAVASIDFGLATLLGSWLEVHWEITLSTGAVFGVCAVVVLSQACANLGTTGTLARFNKVSMWWHVGGVAVIAGALALAPSEHQDLSVVLGHWTNETGWWYGGVLGLVLPAQYTYCGWDACAHHSEETVAASVNAPRGIVRAILVSAVAGLVLLLALTWSISDRSATRAADSPPMQIFLDALGPAGSQVMMVIIAVAMWLCGNAEIGAVSRQVHAFSRSRAVPGWKKWTKIHPRTHSPRNAVWLTAAVAIGLTSLALVSNVLYTAVVSINVLGFYCAVAIPIALRIRHRRRFEPGPWHLHGWGIPLGVVSLCWIAMVSVLAVLPTARPEDGGWFSVETFNFAGPMVLALLVLAWILRRRNGHKWHSPRASSSPALPEWGGGID